ncbi:conserved hypothetical protein [Histoplasma capsulatum var. duboisii H88]|uniref:Uncharacterized protein n=1 Tax=Ajellomyces capsulatus (strain H88) TaxID=544711 RepID=F0UVM7_AJEC8|nr:conserved hypothetical protein [Histoplasma capsulatum var. duboisii H88]
MPPMLSQASEGALTFFLAFDDWSGEGHAACCMAPLKKVISRDPPSSGFQFRVGGLPPISQAHSSINNDSTKHERYPRCETSYPWPDGRPQPWKRCRRKDIEIINRVSWSSGMVASYLSCGSTSVQCET